MPAALSGAIPSLQARHKKQHLIFFAELLIQLHRWHCHEATRAEADLSILSIPPRIGSGKSDGVSRRQFAVSTKENLGREDSTIPISRAYMCGPWYLPNFGHIHQKVEKPKRDPVV
jgi:hypothetical protein